MASLPDAFHHFSTRFRHPNHESLCYTTAENLEKWFLLLLLLLLSSFQLQSQRKDLRSIKSSKSSRALMWRHSNNSSICFRCLCWRDLTESILDTLDSRNQALRVLTKGVCTRHAQKGPLEQRIHLKHGEVFFLFIISMTTSELSV